MNTITKSVTFAILSAVTFFTAACTKENTTTPKSASHQILKIEQGADLTTTFDYNADNLVNKITTRRNGLSTASQFTYNSDKKVIAVALASANLKYSYTAGQLSKVEFYSPSPDNELIFYSELSYQGGKLSEEKGVAHFMQSADADYKIVYTRNAAGDVATQQQFNWSTQTNGYVAGSKSVFEYDSKTNPLTAMQGLNYTTFGAEALHNITKETVYNAAGKQTAEYNYTYTYDADGYPLTGIKKVTTADAPNVVATQLKFTYKINHIN